MIALSIGSEMANTSSFSIVFTHSVNSCSRVPQPADIGWHEKTVAKKKLTLQLQTVATNAQLKMLNVRPMKIRR